MATVKTRDRIVVFRLTEDEYNVLRDACAEKGARNLSAFTRSELLTGINSKSLQLRLDARFSIIEQRLTDLKSGLEQLTQLLRQESS